MNDKQATQEVATPIHGDLIHGETYVIGDNDTLPLRLFWNTLHGYWMLCRPSTTGDGWESHCVLLGSLIVLVRQSAGGPTLVGTRYTVDDLRLVESLDLEVWGDIVDYAAAHLPGAG